MSLKNENVLNFFKTVNLNDVSNLDDFEIFLRIKLINFNQSIKKSNHF